jgi:hypothetical protein
MCYLEGDYKQCLEHCKMSHKYIKDTKIWEASAILTFKVLKKL